MKKIFLLLLNSEKNEALKKLKNIGVVHLEDIKGSSEKLDTINTERDVVQRSISILPDVKDKDIKSVSYKKEETIEISKRIINLNDDLKSVFDLTLSILKEIKRIEVWGDFDPGEINNLRNNGVDFKFYKLKKSVYRDLPKNLTIFKIAQSRSYGFYVTINDQTQALENFTEVQIPKIGLSELYSELEEKKVLKAKIEKELQILSYSKYAIEELLKDCNDELEFESIYSGLAVDGSIAYLQGYIPVENVDLIKVEAASNAWAIILKDPEREDPVPTAVRNSKVVRIIQPVFDLFGILPGYYEKDISFFFLVFLSVFFAMIVGDGGYGLIFFSIATFLGISIKKKSGKIPDFAILLIIMSFLTIIWGAITGTWFGSKTLSGLPFLKILTIYKIANFTANDTSSLIMYICFILGVIHISIAHIWNFGRYLKKGRVLKSISEIGWLSIVVGLYFYVLNFVLDPSKFPVPNFALYMILGGFISLLIFSEQDSNFFKGILRGLGSIITIFFGTVGAFADIISYIRLFAVGLATLAVASSFNDMAASTGHGVVGIIGAVLILTLGHGLNFTMSILAIVVHGVRLNVLEFSGHLGMEWSGIYYNPFRNRKK